MDQATLAPPSLFELLARQWRRPAPIAASSFNTDQTAVAFASTDGSLAIAAMADPEPPERRVRVSTETGRATIRHRDQPVRPAVVVGPFDDRAPPVAPHRRASFAVGGHDGRVLAITPRGQIAPFAARLGERAAAIDHHAPSGLTACAAAGEVLIFTDDDTAHPQRLEHERPLTALAFSPDGRELAAAHAAGVAVWPLHDPRAGRELAFAGGPTAIAWSPAGDWLACPLTEEGFQLLRAADGAGGPVLGYPTPTRSLAWSRAGNALATSGAFRAVAWSMGRLPLDDALAGALETGRPGLVVVECVAAHPRRDLLAVGYANGQVSVMQLGRRDELLLRQDGGGAVNALAWSDDGAHLAIGAADGTAAVAGFPPHLFK